MDSNAADQPPPIRLSILHLLLLMTSMGVLLGVQPELRQDASPWEFYYYYGLVFCSAALGGVCLASLWLLATYGFRLPCAFPRQPGHWLLVAGGLNTLARIVFYLVFIKNHRFATYELISNWHTFSMCVQALVWIEVSIVALLSLERGGWRAVFYFPLVWRTLFLLGVYAVAANDWPMDFRIVRTISVVEGLVFSLVVLLQTFLDRRTKRDWLHYVGIAVYILNGLFSVAVMNWYSGR